MSSLIGLWMYTALFYRGEVMPIPNKDLKLFITFTNQSQNEIYYYRLNENGFCRRQANYTLDETHLEQVVTSVDPENMNECSLDTDMQMGNRSKVKYHTENDKLHLHLTLGDEEIQYIFSKISD
jgi:hypothetical protein